MKNINMNLDKNKISHNNKKICNLSQILDLYDVFLFDVYGVLKDSNGPYQNAVEFFNDLSKKKECKIISNTSLLPNLTSKKLNEKGFKIDKDNIFTSGGTAYEMIFNSEKYLGLKIPQIFYFSNFFSDIEYELKDYLVTDIKKSNLILFNMVIDNEYEAKSLIDKLKKIYTKYNLPLFSLNPDKLIPYGNGIRYCPGYFSNFYSSIGGKIFLSGKPEKIIFDYAISNIKVEKNKILMIGDTIDTDILGAKNAGINSALVTTGNTQRLIKEYKCDVYELLEKNNIYPDYVINLI